MPKVPPTAAKRSELPSSHNSKSSSDSDDNDNGDKAGEYIGGDDGAKGKEDDDDDDDANLYSFPTSNAPVTGPPPNTLYKVQATHKYAGEDVDELTFDPGELIYVIPFENPEEQDDGWQMGIKQSDGIKGVFPENFTIRASN